MLWIRFLDLTIFKIESLFATDAPSTNLRHNDNPPIVILPNDNLPQELGVLMAQPHSQTISSLMANGANPQTP
jgi:hypothetical protein